MNFATTAIELECNPSAPALARRHLCNILGSESVADVYPDALLVLSELVTNAVLHTDCIHVRVEIDVHSDGRLRLAVVDTDATRPMARQPAPDEVGALGLFIVDSVARHWGVEIARGAKVVWAEIEASDRV
jgi:signal transduction histidine kinase